MYVVSPKPRNAVYILINTKMNSNSPIAIVYVPSKYRSTSNLCMYINSFLFSVLSGPEFYQGATMVGERKGMLLCM